MSAPSSLAAGPGPRIPPAPPAARRRGGDGRYLIWFVLFVLSAIVGAAFYEWLPGMSDPFDDLVKLVFH